MKSNIVTDPKRNLFLKFSCPTPFFATAQSISAQTYPITQNEAVFTTIFTEAIDIASFMANDITLAGATGTHTFGSTETEHSFMPLGLPVIKK